MSHPERRRRDDGIAIRQQILVAGDQVVRLARGQLVLRALRRVLDTNVVVSGVLTPIGPPGHLLDLVLAGEVTLVMEPRVAGEYRKVLLCPRFGLDPAYVHQLIDALEEIGVQVTALPVLKRQGVIVRTPRQCLEDLRQ